MPLVAFNFKTYNNFRSFFGKNAALTRFSGLPLPVPSVC